MGVRGLTTFIDCHPQLLTDFQLQNTKLVIDGNNLYHFLYYFYHVPHQFGGDYDRFSNSCVTFFKSLKSCGVEPYVVFDGAYASDGSKFKTSLGRARDRIRLTGVVAAGESAKLLPIHAHDVFYSVLRMLEIPHVTCNFEADRQVAALANEWHCPVLTNDSDFFIFDITCGVILLDYVNLQVHKQKAENDASVHSLFMKVQIFFCKDLMKLLQLHDHRMIVLFATLLGNDIVHPGSFDTFFARVRLPKGVNRSVKPKRQVKIAGLIDWLHSVHSVEDAVSNVLSLSPHNCRDRVRSLIDESIACYTDLKAELHMHFEPDVDVASYSLSTKDGNSLPDWFKRRILLCELPVALINVLTNRRVILLSQVEQLSEPSSYQCATFLRRVAYGILLSIDHRSDTDDSIVVLEYDRERKCQKCNSIQPVWQLNSKPVPDVMSLHAMDLADRANFVFDVLGTNVENVIWLSTEVKLLASLIRYWIVNCNPKITRLHVIALLLCCLKLGSLDSFILQQQQQPKSSVEVTVSPIDSVVKDDADRESTASTDSKCTSNRVVGSGDERTMSQCEQELNGVKLTLEKFSSVPCHNRAHVFDAALIHSFSQFQTCLQAAAFIVKLADVSDMCTNSSRIFNGTVVYNIMRDLRGRSNPELYVTGLLGRPVIVSCFNRLVELVCNGMQPGEQFASVDPFVRKRTKRKKVKGQQVHDAPLDEDSDQSEQATGYSVADVNVFANCDVDNKFGLLAGCET